MGAQTGISVVFAESPSSQTFSLGPVSPVSLVLCAAPSLAVPSVTRLGRRFPARVFLLCYRFRRPVPPGPPRPAPRIRAQHFSRQLRPLRPVRRAPPRPGPPCVGVVGPLVAPRARCTPAPSGHGIDRRYAPRSLGAGEFVVCRLLTTAVTALARGNTVCRPCPRCWCCAGGRHRGGRQGDVKQTPGGCQRSPCLCRYFFFSRCCC